MENRQFFKRFADHQEIGRDSTDTYLYVFYDNGREIGVWRQDRATTLGTGSVLMPEDADTARYWFKENLGSGLKKWALHPKNPPSPPGPGR